MISIVSPKPLATRRDADIPCLVKYATTDCRQNDDYNMKLSERRAKSVVTYLTNHGISTSRLVAKGFGETMLINHCECEGDRKTPCSEEEQQVNRRTEFKILSLE